MYGDSPPRPFHSPADVIQAWQADPRIRSLAWGDLKSLTANQSGLEITLCLPWLVGEWASLAFDALLPAMAASFFFFLTGLRQVHQGFHESLGIGRRATEWLLVIQSGLMLGAMHAIKFHHLQHHRHCMGPEDYEAASARMPGWKAVLFGPLFPLLLHYHAWRRSGTAYRRWMAFEIAVNFLIVSLALALHYKGISSILLYHIGFMLIGQCLTAFFAVWTVHRDCEGPIHFARTQDGKLKNGISYDMFYHVEHHLFPKVPQRHLPELARRLQAVAPELRQKQVF